MNLHKLKILFFTLFSFSSLGFASPPEGLQMAEARRARPLNQGSKDIVVAIIDTGMDTLHPSLQGNLWTNFGETGIDSHGKDKSQNQIDDDGNGFIDDVHGWNFADNSNDLSDLHGHGTHVAGIIHSIAPKTNIMILKYYDAKASGAENLTNTVKAIRYATQMKAKIINYSGGGTNKYADEEVAIRKAQLQGILFVAAAGNEKSNSDISGFYPANYGLSNIISVTAIDESGKVLPSSNYGSHSVDIAAPGKRIVSTLPGGKFGAMTGTSQATAFVSGTAALLLAEEKNRKAPERLIQQLTQSGNTNDFLIDKTKHQTTLNIYRSLIMKDSNLGAFGNVDETGWYSSTDFSSKLNENSEDFGSAELPFKIQVNRK
ncbi:MAG TPA: S8 family peptidase [Pseudobdellovibrionaceae bacterium]|jgi:subtilisin family serine protease